VTPAADPNSIARCTILAPSIRPVPSGCGIMMSEVKGTLTWANPVVTRWSRTKMELFGEPRVVHGFALRS
jgi:hypothetical protein